jgi:hypothetical protein
MKSARKKNNAALRQLQVYDGQLLLGSISIDGDTFVAFDAKGKRLGSFGDQAAAVSAIDAASSRAPT